MKILYFPNLTEMQLLKAVLLHFVTQTHAVARTLRRQVSKPTASRHLEALVNEGVLSKIGTMGKGTYYVIARKGFTKGSKDSLIMPDFVLQLDILFI